jgi:hypothetical protein
MFADSPNDQMIGLSIESNNSDVHDFLLAEGLQLPHPFQALG